MAQLSARLTCVVPIAGSKPTNKPRPGRATRLEVKSESADRVVSLPTTRRAAVLSLGTACAFLTVPRAPARAVRGQQVCDPGADGAECRERLIAGDAAELGDYDAKAKKSGFEAAKAATPDFTNYQKDTLKLVDEMYEVLALDIYDMQREKRISVLKKDGNTWSSRYAPGGSAKTASGRAFYNAINQVLLCYSDCLLIHMARKTDSFRSQPQVSGHFNANGIAPLPVSRQQVVNDNLEKTRALIAEGR